MTLSFIPSVDPCDKCSGSADGCQARQQFAKGERCCSRCSHSEDNNECPPNNAPIGRGFLPQINQ